MKKIFFVIIFIFLIFSSEKTFASEWKIWDLFNFDFALETFDVNQLSKLKKYSFKYKDTSRVYNTFISYDKTMRSEIINQYKKWKIDYYKTNWLIQDYNTFIYYTNELFLYFKMMEQNKKFLNDKDFQYAFSRSYQNAKIYYKHLQNTFNN